jgi:serine/threonine protein phosphatase PrpC
VEQLGSRMVAVLADGAGGSGAGLSAAKSAVKYVRSQISSASTPEQWGNVVSQLDNVIAQGETTIVIDPNGQLPCGFEPQG